MNPLDVVKPLDPQMLPLAGPYADAGVELVATFGQYEAEYAAIRARVGILLPPSPGILSLTGADRQDFLNRLMTQDVMKMTGGQSVRAFQLNTKGRILADVVIHHGDINTWLETDLIDTQPLADMLDSRLFGEDVRIENITTQRLAIDLHGPSTGDLLAAVCDEPDAAGRMLDMPGTHHVLTIAGQPCTASRRDLCAVPGVRLFVPTDGAGEIYARLLDAAGFDPATPEPATDHDPDAAADYAQRRRGSLRGRPIGWLAFNTARIEAGSPLPHVDFANDSLPHETALLDQAVSFTKGCYLGQEVVARMQNLGHPAKMLAGLLLEDDDLPIAGCQVFEPAAPADDTTPEPKPGPVVGAVTSSANSPLRGGSAIAIAMLKWGKHQHGTALLVPAEGRLARATVTALDGLTPTR